MGSEIHSTINLTVPRAVVEASTFTAAVGKLDDIPELSDIDLGACGTQPIAIAAAGIVGACGIPIDIYDVDVDFTEDGYEIDCSGWGRDNGIVDVLAVLAAAGFTGTVECEEEAGDRYRRRIDADGTVHTDSGHTVYSSGPVTGVWIVQMQSLNEGDLDRVAVVASKSDADAILTSWVREDARTLISDGVIAPHRIDLDASTTELLDQWAATTAVKWEVYPA